MGCLPATFRSMRVRCNDRVRRYRAEAWARRQRRGAEICQFCVCDSPPPVPRVRAVCCPITVRCSYAQPLEPKEIRVDPSRHVQMMSRSAWGGTAAVNPTDLQWTLQNRVFAAVLAAPPHLPRNLLNTLPPDPPDQLSWVICVEILVVHQWSKCSLQLAVHQRPCSHHYEWTYWFESHETPSQKQCSDARHAWREKHHSFGVQQAHSWRRRSCRPMMADVEAWGWRAKPAVYSCHFQARRVQTSREERLHSYCEQKREVHITSQHSTRLDVPQEIESIRFESKWNETECQREVDVIWAGASELRRRRRRPHRIAVSLSQEIGRHESLLSARAKSPRDARAELYTRFVSSQIELVDQSTRTVQLRTVQYIVVKCTSCAYWGQLRIR